MRIRSLFVRASSSGWSLIVDALDTPAWTVKTKARAVAAAKRAAADLKCQLVIEKRSGEVQQMIPATAL